jgi:hypothetical protein
MKRGRNVAGRTYLDAGRYFSAEIRGQSVVNEEATRTAWPARITEAITGAVMSPQALPKRSCAAPAAERIVIIVSLAGWAQEASAVGGRLAIPGMELMPISILALAGCAKHRLDGVGYVEPKPVSRFAHLRN